MATHAPGDTRNVGFVGHGDSGKTSLADAILWKLGAVTRQGSVREKTSIFDFDPMEKDRQHSIDMAVASGTREGKTLNLIDAPGYPDFISEAVSALAAADLALICVNAHNGVAVNTRRVFEIAEARKVPRMIVVTKCDSENVDFDEVLENIREFFGPRCLPIVLPRGIGPALEGATNVLDARGAAGAAEAYNAFVEAAVEVDDALMESYLEGKTLSDEVLEDAFRRAVLGGVVMPVIATSVAKDVGVDDLIRLIVRLGPTPLSRPWAVAEGSGDGAVLKPSVDGPCIGQVVKVHIDKHVGKSCYVRIVSGVLKAGTMIVNARDGKKEKVGHILRIMGKDQPPVEEAVAGDIVAFTKLDSLSVSDTVTTGDARYVLAPIAFPRPMASLAVHPKSRADEAKVSEVLRKLQEEVPTFAVHRETATREQIISGMSNLHLDILLRRVRERYGIELETTIPKVPYKECVTTKGKAQYRHKKQTGGRGQFGEVHLEVSPGEPGKGLDYRWDVFGGAIPTNFKPAVEKGVHEVMGVGVIAGYPIEDITVSVYDGKSHPVDSSEQAFKTAAARAFSEAVRAAKPALLEPIVTVEIIIPSECMGDISGDLNTRRGRIVGMDARGSLQIIRAQIPQSEVAEYARVLTSLTKGEGTYSVEPSHYEVVPPQIQASIMAAWKPHAAEDE